MPVEAGRVYEFGPFRLEPAERQLRRDGRPVPLTPKALDTLHVLVESGGRAISKDELMEKLWPDTTVSEATLAQHIFAVRKAMGGPQCIETIPRFGYRFVTPVRALRATAESRAARPAVRELERRREPGILQRRADGRDDHATGPAEPGAARRHRPHLGDEIQAHQENDRGDRARARRVVRGGRECTPLGHARPRHGPADPGGHPDAHVGGELRAPLRGHPHSAK